MWSLMIATTCAIDQIDLKILDLTRSSIHSDLTDVSPAERTELLQRLRKIASGEVTHIGGQSPDSGAYPGQSNAQIVLMRMGDIPGIEQIIQRYRQYDAEVWDYPKYFEWSKQPLLIPYLAEDLFLNDDPAHYIDTGDVAVPNRSIYSGIVIVRIVRSSPVFSDELRLWAKRMYQVWVDDPARFRKTMRIWWNANAKTFQQQNYAAVAPGPLEAAQVAGTPSASPRSSSTPTGAVPNVRTSQSVFLKPECSHHLTTLILIAFVLGGSGYIILRRLSNK
jgi:hypothetical protein